jgi:putative phage-type endonuclease
MTMQAHHLVQGSPEWHAHRASHFNASDAPAMLGCCPYKTRSQLLKEKHTGVRPEVDASTQRRFDAGHAFEALARPFAEDIIGDDLAPVVGSLGELSASFDGLTLMGDTAFEHKTLNADLRACIKDQGNGYDLPKHYRVQMEQQLLVSGAERVLFMASEWTGDGTLVEERHCWYASDPALRAEIIAGWKQFQADLAAYVPPTASSVEKIVAEPVEALPAPVVTVTGQLALQDNFKVFETRLRDFLENRLIREPKTDEDFVNLDAQIKAMKQAREALGAAEAQMLAQVQPVDQAKKTKDMLDKLLQQNCSMAEKLLKDEKERRRGEIVAAGRNALEEHVNNLNRRLGRNYMPPVLALFGDCIKGLKSLASMEDKVATELARAKIVANEIADRIDLNLQHLRDHAADFKALFPDAAQLVLKAPDDCKAVVTARIAEHKAAEEKRLQAERERIRAEEAARLEREQQAREAAERRQREESERQAAAEQRRQEAERAEQARQAAEAAKPVQAPAPEPVSAPAVIQLATITRAPVATPPTLRLGQINERLAPLSIDAAGLAALGFPHAATEKAAKLYHEADFPRMCAELIAHIQDVQRQREAA